MNKFLIWAAVFLSLNVAKAQFFFCTTTPTLKIRVLNECGQVLVGFPIRGYQLDCLPNCVGLSDTLGGKSGNCYIPGSSFTSYGPSWTSQPTYIANVNPGDWWRVPANFTNPGNYPPNLFLPRPAYMSVASNPVEALVSNNPANPITGDIVINNAYIPGFKLNGVVLDMATPVQLYLCSATTTFPLSNTTQSYSAPVMYKVDISNYIDFDNTPLVWSSGWVSSPPAQLPSLVGAGTYLITWSVRSTCAKSTDIGQSTQGLFYLNGLPTVSQLNFSFKRPNAPGAPITSLLLRNQITPTAANPINAPLIGAVTAEARAAYSSGLKITPVIEEVNCNTGVTLTVTNGVPKILCDATMSTSANNNIFLSSDLVNGVSFANLYIDGDGLNAGNNAQTQNYFATQALGTSNLLLNRCFKISLKGQSVACATAPVISQWSYFRFQTNVGNPFCPACRHADSAGSTEEQDLAIDRSSLTAYPNPTSSILTIAFSAKNTGNARVSLSDLTGRTVQEIFQNVVDGENIVEQSIEQLPIGMYIYTVQAGEQILTGKIIKN